MDQNPYIDRDTAVAERQQTYRLRSPARWRRFLETRAAFEAMLLLPTSPLWATRQRGDGRQIVLVPGFLADDRSTWPLRQYLTFLGYDALPWGLGRNAGAPDRDAERLVDALGDIRRPGEPVTLIGWSLGGVISREVARQAPDAVREVITMGTPVEGGPKYTLAAAHYDRRGTDLDDVEARVHAINTQGISQPLTVIYSQDDGVVDWRAAIDRYNPQARHIRVHGSHLGLGTNPQVWLSIEKTLRRRRD
ncbi:MAG: alpha/beta fold hydrolase [Pseudomonadota bacterium]